MIVLAGGVVAVLVFLVLLGVDIDRDAPVTGQEESRG